MANNPYVNKVQLANGTVLIDISDTTAAASDVAAGKIFYTAAGVPTTGTKIDKSNIVTIVDTLDEGGGTIKTITAEEVSLISTTITSNGTYTPASSVAYSTVVINIPTGYTADQIAFGTMTGAINITESGDIRERAFAQQTNITSVSASSVSRINGYAFRDCTNLASISFPNTPIIYAVECFRNCTSLTTVCFPKLGTHPTATKYFSNGTFYGCTQLTSADLGYVTGLGGNTFYNDTKFNLLILRYATAPVSAGNTNVFYNSPMGDGGTGGTIYIPKALYDHLGDGTSLDYKAASNWSVMDGYGKITWAKIEGSYYETHFLDGTEIPTT